MLFMRAFDVDGFGDGFQIFVVILLQKDTGTTSKMNKRFDTQNAKEVSAIVLERSSSSSPRIVRRAAIVIHWHSASEVFLNVRVFNF